jgi:hypothetical protein
VYVTKVPEVAIVNPVLAEQVVYDRHICGIYTMHRNRNDHSFSTAIVFGQIIDGIAATGEYHHADYHYRKGLSHIAGFAG